MGVGNSKKKILMCGSDFSNGGGVVTVTQNLINYPEWGDYEIHYIPTHINGSATKKIIFFAKGLKDICKFIKKERVYIAHLHTCDGGPFIRKGLILRLLKIKGIKVVLHHHTDYSEYFANLGFLTRLFVKKTLKTCDVNIVLGNNLIMPIVKLEPKAKVKVIFNGIPIQSKRKYNGSGKYILFMGWLLERKGVLDLISAIKIADKNLDSMYKIALCGSGDDSILSRIREIGIDDRITFFGWVNAKKKEEILSNSVLSVLPSYREAAPMAIMEAMAFGIPTVASSIAAIPEIINDGKTGILLKDHDIYNLSRIIAELISDSDLREKISINAYRDITTRFSIGKQVRDIIELYDGLLVGEKHEERLWMG